MNSENSIEVRNVFKSFKVFKDRANTLKELTIFSNRRKFEKRQVLNNISFNVKKGEAVGLIGHNGCGKSTTLKLLTRIMYPDEGTIEMKGRVSSLIELGAGFHPDMSGRENIYINASIFGLSKKEIDERLEDIIEFSELEEFIDNPVRTYSSGMYMRLAFSVAINVDADILLIDEILAVGDTGFQTKCFNRLKEIKGKGTTIVIVSHSMGQIESICDRSIWIHEGQIHREGDPKIVDNEYLEYMSQERREISEKELHNKAVRAQKKRKESDTDDPEVEADAETKELPSDETVEVPAEEKPVEEKKRWGNQHAVIKKVELFNDKGERKHAYTTGDDISIKIIYSVNEPVKDADFGIGLFRIDNLQCYGTNTRIDKMKLNLEKNGSCIVKCKNVNLIPGQYWIDIAIEEGMGLPVDYWRDAVRFDVYSSVSDVGVCRIDHEWVLPDGVEEKGNES